MSGCERFGTDLGAALDGELEPREATAFEAHLPGCDACREALEAWRALGLRVAGLPRVAPSPQFEARFWARLARDREPAPRRHWRAWLVELALAGAAVAALFWLVTPPDASLPDPDWEIVAEADRFDLLMDEDLDLLWTLDDLDVEAVEEWNGTDGG